MMKIRNVIKIQWHIAYLLLLWKKLFANRNHMKTIIYMYSIDSQYEIYLPTCIMESFLEYNDIGFCTLFKTWNIFINH